MVTSDTRGACYESSHRQILIVFCQVYRKDENKLKKRPGMAHLKNYRYDKSLQNSLSDTLSFQNFLLFFHFMK